MSSARSHANHRLYLARILLDCWRDALDGERVPAVTLSQAFGEAVREHLVAAYGWFLLEITRPEPVPPHPPRGCSELPAVAAGKAVPGEIRELAQLEESGWLAALLSGEEPAPETRRSEVNLAVPADHVPGPGQLQQWADYLEGLFDRMGEFLDEY
ncbi:MAG: hypothetical protein P8Y92_07030 [Halioglobus sp.]|jgi:hypothetical protein